MNAHIHTCKGGGKIVRVYLASCQSNLLFPFQLTLLHTSYTHRYKSTGASRIDGHTRLYKYCFFSQSTQQTPIYFIFHFFQPICLFQLVYLSQLPFFQLLFQRQTLKDFANLGFYSKLVFYSNLPSYSRRG